MYAFIIIAFLCVYILKTSSITGRTSFFIALLSNLFWLGIYELDLIGINRVVYWSDAEFYLRGADITNRFLSFSWFINDLRKVGLMPFSIRLIMAVLTSLVHSLFIDSFSIKRINKTILILVLLNPFFSISLIRLMKDAYLLLFLALTIRIMVGNSKKLILLWLICMLFVLPSIRPWTVILPPIFYAIHFFSTNGKKSKLKILVPALFFIVAIALYYENISIWYEFITSGKLSNYDLSFSNQILGPFRLLYSPGINRLLFAQNHFLYFMPSLLISIGLGLILNYLLISYVSISSILKKLQNCTASRYTIVYCLIAIVVYSFAYSGSVEFRVKASILLPLTYILSSSLITRKKHFLFRTLFYFSTIILFTLFAF